MTPEEKARNLLHQADTTTLLQAFASLTHVIHSIDDAGDPHGVADKKRAERDEIKDEILRRTGDLK